MRGSGRRWYPKAEPPLAQAAPSRPCPRGINAPKPLLSLVCLLSPLAPAFPALLAQPRGRGTRGRPAAERTCFAPRHRALALRQQTCPGRACPPGRAFPSLKRSPSGPTGPVWLSPMGMGCDSTRAPLEAASQTSLGSGGRPNLSVGARRRVPVPTAAVPAGRRDQGWGLTPALPTLAPSPRATRGADPSAAALGVPTPARDHLSIPARGRGPLCRQPHSPSPGAAPLPAPRAPSPHPAPPPRPHRRPVLPQPIPAEPGAASAAALGAAPAAEQEGRGCPQRFWQAQGGHGPPARGCQEPGAASAGHLPVVPCGWKRGDPSAVTHTGVSPRVTR